MASELTSEQSPLEVVSDIFDVVADIYKVFRTFSSEEFPRRLEVDFRGGKIAVSLGEWEDKATGYGLLKKREIVVDSGGEETGYLLSLSVLLDDNEKGPESESYKVATLTMLDSDENKDLELVKSNKVFFPLSEDCVFTSEEAKRQALWLVELMRTIQLSLPILRPKADLPLEGLMLAEAVAANAKALRASLHEPVGADVAAPNSTVVPKQEVSTQNERRKKVLRKPEISPISFGGSVGFAGESRK